MLGMIFYALLCLLWLAVAIVVPLGQSLHALKEKSDERKLWLVYWVVYALGTKIFPFAEWLLQLPFLILSFFISIDLFLPAQIGVLAALVIPHPSLFFLKTAVKLMEENQTQVIEAIKKAVDMAKTFGTTQVEALKKKAA
mmetsp:Transcript_59273/g.94066  ORF Transcript_59273/g.94066 Transcript_59273/m.94066 type:complete len:140 (+) Transcript_59273:91-510(+)